jgi:hypothetical protein
MLTSLNGPGRRRKQKLQARGDRHGGQRGRRAGHRTERDACRRAEHRQRNTQRVQREEHDDEDRRAGSARTIHPLAQHGEGIEPGIHEIAEDDRDRDQRCQRQESNELGASKPGVAHSHFWPRYGFCKIAS